MACDETHAAVVAFFHLEVTRGELQRPPIDMEGVTQVKAHFVFSCRSMGNRKRRLPSKRQKALATAAAVGTRPISPTPLAP